METTGTISGIFDTAIAASTVSCSTYVNWTSTAWTFSECRITDDTDYYCSAAYYHGSRTYQSSYSESDSAASYALEDSCTDVGTNSKASKTSDGTIWQRHRTVYKFLIGRTIYADDDTTSYYIIKFIIRTHYSGSFTDTGDNYSATGRSRTSTSTSNFTRRRTSLIRYVTVTILAWMA